MNAGIINFIKIRCLFCSIHSTCLLMFKIHFYRAQKSSSNTCRSIGDDVL